MWLDYLLDGKVQVQMFNYIDNMLADLPEDMCGMVTSPAADHLFTVNNTGKKLTWEQAEMFHHNVALWNFGAYRLEFSSSICQLVGLGGLFCQLNGTEQGSLVTII